MIKMAEKMSQIHKSFNIYTGRKIFWRMHNIYHFETFHAENIGGRYLVDREYTKAYTV